MYQIRKHYIICSSFKDTRHSVYLQYTEWCSGLLTLWINGLKDTIEFIQTYYSFLWNFHLSMFSTLWCIMQYWARLLPPTRIAKTTRTHLKKSTSFIHNKRFLLEVLAFGSLAINNSIKNDMNTCHCSKNNISQSDNGFFYSDTAVLILNKSYAYLYIKNISLNSTWIHAQFNTSETAWSWL